MPGEDIVTNKHLMHAVTTLAYCLTAVFDHIYIPFCWKRGFITPLHEDGARP